MIIKPAATTAVGVTTSTAGGTSYLYFTSNMSDEKKARTLAIGTAVTAAAVTIQGISERATLANASKYMSYTTDEELSVLAGLSDEDIEKLSAEVSLEDLIDAPDENTIEKNKQQIKTL